jgi:hypothetical protein
MAVFVRAIVTGFGFSLGAALFKKFQGQLGLGEEEQAEAESEGERSGGAGDADGDGQPDA